MRKYPVILDLETKHTFREYEKHKDLGISVAGVYNYKDQQFSIFKEDELNKLFLMFENASYIVGFNIDHFDMPVLQAHYPGKIEQFQTFDICEDVKNRIGKRYSLNDLLQATLGKKKTGHGLAAIDLYREGKIDELIQYCKDDVMLTKDLFDHGVENRVIHYLDSFGKKDIEVDWQKYLEDSSSPDISLTLPF